MRMKPVRKHLEELRALATVRYPALEATATVEQFDNGRGFSLRVWRAGEPRIHPGQKVAYAALRTSIGGETVRSCNGQIHFSDPTCPE